MRSHKESKHSVLRVAFVAILAILAMAYIVSLDYSASQPRQPVDTARELAHVEAQHNLLAQAMREPDPLDRARILKETSRFEPVED